MQRSDPSVHLSIRLPTSAQDLIRRAARTSGMPVSQVISRGAVDYAGRLIERGPLPDAVRVAGMVAQNGIERGSALSTEVGNL